MMIETKGMTKEELKRYKFNLMCTIKAKRSRGLQPRTEVAELKRLLDRLYRNNDYAMGWKVGDFYYAS